MHKNLSICSMDGLTSSIQAQSGEPSAVVINITPLCMTSMALFQTDMINSLVSSTLKVYSPILVPPLFPIKLRCCTLNVVGSKIGVSILKIMIGVEVLIDRIKCAVGKV